MWDPIYDNEDENKFIYHYTSFETLLKILITKSLKFNNYGKSNDPYETKKLHFTTIKDKSSSSLKEVINPWELLKVIDEEFETIISNYKTLSFCKDKKPFEKNSLSNRGLTKLRMWSQYADNHKGGCLIFENNLFQKKVKDTFGEKVFFENVTYHNFFEKDSHQLRRNISTLYLNEFCSNSKEAIQDNLESFPKEMFFIKDVDWEHEDEFRFVLFQKNDNIDSYINISDSLKGLIIGKQVCKEFTDILKNLCFNSGIFIRRFDFGDHFF